MVYHFVKHIGFDIKADSLEQAKEIAEAIDECDGEYNGIEDVAYDTMIDAIDDALDVGVLRDDVYDDCNVHAGKTEYVGYTEDKNTDDPEERLYDYLTGDADDDCDEDEDYDDSNEDKEEVSKEVSLEDLALMLFSTLMSSVWSV